MKNSLAYGLLVFLNLLSTVCLSHSDLERTYFFENKGQWPQNVKYRADVVSGFVFLEEQSMVFSFYDNQNPRFFHPYTPSKYTQLSASKADLIDCRAYRVSFLESNTPSISHCKSRSQEYRNYFFNKKAAAPVWGYDTVFYQELYQGIDMQIFQSHYDLKYEFKVRAGSQVRQLKMQYSDVSDLFLKNGNLHIAIGKDTVIELKPVSFQYDGKKRIEIETAFQIHDNTVSFYFPNGYDKNLDLIIDPTLVFSSFSGSVADNWGNTAAYDSLGNLYSVGTVFGVNFPVTTGSFSVDFSGLVDVAIIKYDTRRQIKLYASFFGGRGVDIPVSVVCDSQQNLMILGLTDSDDMPFLSNSFQKKHSGGSFLIPISGYEMDRGADIFLAQISGNGRSLLAFTYMGGGGTDGVVVHPSLNKNYGDAIRMEVILDSLDQVYVVYPSNSIDLNPTKTYGSTALGSVFVQKFSADLSRSLWLTSIGSSGRETGCTIRLRGKNVLVGGATTGSDFPVSDKAAQKINLGGVSDGFLAQFEASNGELLHCSLVGTSGYDKVFYVDYAPNSNNIFCLGQTDGRFAQTQGLYTNRPSGQFLIRWNDDLSQMTAITTIGSRDGNPDFVPTGFQVSNCGNINITGWAGVINANTSEIEEDNGFVGGSTLNLPITPDAFIRTASPDSSDFYFMVLSDQMNRLIYATYFGGTQGNGEHVDGGTSRFSPDGTIYQALCACRSRNQLNTAPNVPTTNGSSIGSQNCNNMAFKFDLGKPNARFSPSQNSGCAPLTVNFVPSATAGLSFTWEIVGILKQSSTTNTPLTHRFEKPGKYIVRYTVDNPDFCTSKVVYVDTIEVFIPDYSISGDSLICAGESTTITVSTDGAVIWYPPLNVNTKTITVTPKQTIAYKFKVSKGEGCEFDDQFRVEVVPPIVPKIQVFGGGECGSEPLLTALNQTSSADQFVWTVNGETLMSKEIRSYLLPDTGCYVIGFYASRGRCKADSTFNFCLEKLVIPNVFTPNEDGINDNFDINARYGPHALVVVNRWGQVVFESNDYKNQWKAEGLEKGVYYYALFSPSGKVCKGWVMVEE